MAASLGSEIDRWRALPAVAAYVRRGRRERVEPALCNRTRALGHVGLAFGNRPLAPTATAAHALVPGATVNDAMLAGVAAGVADWLTEAGEPVTDFRALMPVDVLHAGRRAGGPSNRTSRSFVRLPVTEPDPVRRLELVQARTERVKRDEDARASLMLAHWVGRVPRPMSRRLRSWVDREVETFNLSVTDVRGPDAPVTVLGCPVRLVYPLSTLTGFNGINVDITSMQDRLCYSVMANARAIADPAPVVAGIERTLDALERRAAPSPAREA
jgi:hypothetical protein